MAVVRHVIQEFHLSLDELHNDSTTVTFCGAYPAAQQEDRLRGRPTHAITWGHNKDHRPDLKQLLYILTVTEDGGVPVYFSSASGNVVDDETHQQTWQLLHELVGQPGFLYVADCKLATTENMKYIARQNGRFVSVLPRTRKEDKEFRERLRDNPNAVPWQHLYDLTDKEGNLRDRLRVCAMKCSARKAIACSGSTARAKPSWTCWPVRAQRRTGTGGVGAATPTLAWSTHPLLRTKQGRAGRGGDPQAVRGGGLGEGPH